ncbi:fasciclin domain-containing protein [Nibricoccus sp. IMCC34717]|uniref:fasciclin domain-containing protein n=1 Tax=Nibricoccus sp. IMCC34717 TaxID=3034021 RepID=UPI00384FA169
MKSPSLKWVAGLLLSLAPLSYAETFTFTAMLSGTSQVPSVTTPASGRALVMVDSETKQFTAYVTTAGIASAITMSHIHEAPAGQNGGVVANFGGAASYVSAAQGFNAGKFTGTYNGDFAKLLSGGAYVNIHTTTYGSGELRGQLMLHPKDAGRLIALSARGRVDQSAGQPIILGLVLDRETRVMVRSLGKSLSMFGVSNPLQDTYIRVYNAGAQVIATNDNWMAAQHNAVASTGLAPFDASDSALIRHMPAGTYTIEVPVSKGTGTAIAEAYTLPNDNIPEALIKSGNFNTLVAAVQTAGLVDVLLGPGPFTLFAPTDAAFAKLPAGTVESLLLPENRATLVAILLYHLVPAKVLSTDLSNGMSAPTLQGGNLTVDLTSGVKINTSNVTEADWTTSNGVIHVVDTILLPPS